MAGMDERDELWDGTKVCEMLQHHYNTEKEEENIQFLFLSHPVQSWQIILKTLSLFYQTVFILKNNKNHLGSKMIYTSPLILINQYCIQRLLWHHIVRKEKKYFGYNRKDNNMRGIWKSGDKETMINVKKLMLQGSLTQIWMIPLFVN